MITLITVFMTPQPSAPTVRETPQPVVSPAPSATAVPPKDEALKTGPPSLPASLTVIQNGRIAKNQVVGGQVIIEGPAYEYTDQMVKGSKNEVVPRNLTDIACWSGGGLPGSNQSNTPPRPASSNAPQFTSYCYGHSWVSNAVFNSLRSLTPGTSVILQVTTANGYIYAYELLSSFHVPKGQLGNDPRVVQDVVNRMVTVSCYRPDGYPPNQATVDNIVGIWQMTAVLDHPWSETLPPDEEMGVKVPRGAVRAE